MIIEITRLIGRTLKRYPLTGIDRVCVEYLNHFMSKAKTSLFLWNRFYVLDRKISRTIAESLCSQSRSSLLKNLLISPFHVESTSDGELYINLTHSGGVESESFQNIAMKKLRKVFMIHDLIPLDHPEFTRDGEKERHKIRLKNVVKYGDLILTNSEYTKNRLLDYARSLFGTDISDKVEVNYLGLSKKLENVVAADYNYVKKKYHIADNYFIVVSTIEPRKNHLILFYAWKELFQILGKGTPMLLLVGRRGWKVDYLINLINSSNIADFIREINSCSDAELKCLIENSQALLFPSIDEGFGLPVLEGIKLGCITVCSKLPVLQELFGDIPYYCSWSDASEWVEIVLKILSSRNKLLNIQNERVLKNSKLIGQYSWDAHFERLSRILSNHGIAEYSELEKEVELEFATKC